MERRLHSDVREIRRTAVSHVNAFISYHILSIYSIVCRQLKQSLSCLPSFPKKKNDNDFMQIVSRMTRACGSLVEIVENKQKTLRGVS